MESILICPGERASVGFLSQPVPIVAAPMLGENLLSYWIESLAIAGLKDIVVLATDRPEVVRTIVGDGTRWGVRVQVQAELKELSAAEVVERGQCRQDQVIVIDHLPGAEDRLLFRSYRDYFDALVAWMPRAAKTNRIGLREIEPQIWCGRRVHISAGAKLHAPCWVGDYVSISADTVVGPGAILEDRVVTGAAAEIRSSVVGPDTYVGSLTKLENSIAWGSTLLDWRSGSCTQVPDPFLLCALGQRYVPGARLGLGARWRQRIGSMLARWRASPRPSRKTAGALMRLIL
jgi:NDP-sugar pyrophosphorylase family protein